MARSWYYVVAWPKGQNHMVVLGPFDDESTASSTGMTKLTVPYETIELPTKDRNRATRMCKSKYLQQSADLDGALQTAQHKTE